MRLSISLRMVPCLHLLVPDRLLQLSYLICVEIFMDFLMLISEISYKFSMIRLLVVLQLEMSKISGTHLDCSISLQAPFLGDHLQELDLLLEHPLHLLDLEFHLLEPQLYAQELQLLHMLKNNLKVLLSKHINVCYQYTCNRYIYTQIL